MNLKRNPRIKIERHLFRVGEAYYYRKGRIEESLGRFPNDKKAIEAKQLFETLKSRIGSEAFEWKVKHLWPDYMKERHEQLLGTIKGRKKISEATYIEIRDIWEKHLKKFFANVRLSEIDAVKWNEYCRKAKVADLTNHRKVFGFFLRWCEQNGKMKFIPTMKIPPVERRKRKTLTPSQINLVLEHSKDSLLLFVAQYLFMGMRRSEQMKLAWKHVNLKERWILIADETTRTRSGRVIPMNSFVHALLTHRMIEQRNEGLDTPWVFPKAGRPDEHATEEAPSKAWHKMLKNAGLGASGIEPHDLRATFEHYANKRSDFTDTQREKMAGASIQTQRKIYLQGFQADDLRGLEEVVIVEGLERIIQSKLLNSPDDGMGKTRGGSK